MESVPDAVVRALCDGVYEDVLAAVRKEIGALVRAELAKARERGPVPKKKAETVSLLDLDLMAIDRYVAKYGHLAHMWSKKDADLRASLDDPSTEERKKLAANLRQTMRKRKSRFQKQAPVM